MLEHLIDSNELRPEFEKYELDLSTDLPFIKELIGAPLQYNEQTVSTTVGCL